MKRILLALTILLASAAPSHAADVNETYLEGLSLYQAGNYPAAEGKFMSALRVNNKHLSSLFMMGETLAKDVRRLREAEGWYYKVLRDGEKERVYTSKTLLSLGTLYLQMGLYEKAIQQFRALIAAEPESYLLPRAYNEMGVACYHLDQYDEALGFFKKALKLDPNILEAKYNTKTLQGQLSLVNTARYYERMGDQASALEQYKKAVEEYPGYVAAWYHLGLLQNKTGDYPGAVRSLMRAKALNPKYMGGGDLTYQLALALEGRGGESDLDEALRLYQANLPYKESRLRAGIILLAHGMLDQAEEMLAAVASGDEEDKKTQAEALFRLGRICEIKEEKEKAREYFRKASFLVPGEKRYKEAEGQGQP